MVDDMSTNIINHLQHRVATIKQNLQDATHRMEQLKAEIQRLDGDLQGYERALSAEMRESGITGASKDAEQESLPLNSEPPSNDSAGNKAEFARQFIRGRSESGATPSDIMKGFQ